MNGIFPVNPKVTFIKGSILDDEKLKWAFKEKPQIVYHLAAHFANQNSVDNPETDLMVNGMGTLKVLEHAHLVGVERFIYASSGCGIYGADSKMPFSGKLRFVGRRVCFCFQKRLAISP